MACLVPKEGLFFFKSKYKSNKAGVYQQQLFPVLEFFFSFFLFGELKTLHLSMLQLFRAGVGKLGPGGQRRTLHL